MKRALGLIVLLCGSLVAADLKPIDEAGYAKLVSEAKGKVLLVHLWGSWCKPSKTELPRMVALLAKLNSQMFQLVTISTDEPERVKDATSFLDQIKMPAPVYWRKVRDIDEDQFAKAIDGRWNGAVPSSFLYDKTGKRVHSFYGETNMAELETAIRKLL